MAGEIGADFDLSAKFIRETMLSLREGIYTGDKELVKDTLNKLNQDDYLALWRLIPSYERRLIKEMSRGKSD